MTPAICSQVLGLCKVRVYCVGYEHKRYVNATAAVMLPLRHPSITTACCSLGPNKSTMFVAWDEVKSRLVLSCRVRISTTIGHMLMLLPSLPPIVMQMFCLCAGKASAPCSDMVAHQHKCRVLMLQSSLCMAATVCSHCKLWSSTFQTVKSHARPALCFETTTLGTAAAHPRLAAF